MFERVVHLLIYASSVYISSKYANGYWVVGPVFGLAVISWDSDTFRKFVAAKHIAYLAASSLIYALVYHISRQNWNRGSDLMDSVAGSLAVGVIVGSALLPFAHQIFLSANLKTARKAFLLLVAAYYIVTAVSWANDEMNWGLRINFLTVMIAAWQGAYLYAFFGSKGK
jgi:hypothetical protein